MGLSPELTSNLPTNKMHVYTLSVDGAGAVVDLAGLSSDDLYVAPADIGVDFLAHWLQFTLKFSSQPLMSTGAFGHGASALASGLDVKYYRDSNPYSFLADGGIVQSIDSNLALVDLASDIIDPVSRWGFSQSAGEYLFTVRLGKKLWGQPVFLDYSKSDKIVVTVNDAMAAYITYGEIKIIGTER